MSVLVDEEEMSVWTLFAVLAWVVGGNALIHFGLSRVHRSERENLGGTGTLFDQAAVPTIVKTSSLLAWSIRWVTADVLVTTRGAVLFQRNLFTAQPPIRLVRSRDEANAIKRWLVVPVIITNAPRIESGALVIVGEGRRVGRYKLVVNSDRADELQSALDMFLHPPEARAARRPRDAS